MPGVETVAFNDGWEMINAALGGEIWAFWDAKYLLSAA